MNSTPPRSTCMLAVASLVSGILAWTVLPLVGALAAVVCGHLARGEIRRAPEGMLEGRGMAVAGLVLGYLQFAVALLPGALLYGILFLAWHG
ncbi:hypothetical protein ASG87_04110 [Frateuria sp. Soil773]|uniref:DUF4190 domain-containing protein n=1 Tax=Frateuria sp. Soil773 TaxID=1736407 RepID=UPI0006FDEAC2|nr:DUF4190 domain-containing protein [Frateuria sp. Soil773]KRE89517.1 hypothetical protein ASG87_04110 [Frateuria sp. Soil773]